VITWLHLSDLHFRESQEYNENIVLKALLTDVTECISRDSLQPDFVTISGDIAHASRSREYMLAEAFLKDLLQITSLSRDRLFVVPGNHDVDRNEIVNSTFATRAAEILSSRVAVNSFLSNLTERELVFQRFHNYKKFIQDFFAECRPFDQEQYFYVKSVEVYEWSIAILGLNSAWLAGSDIDRNRLILGEQQVRSALEVARGADVVIGVMHHPLDWLQEFDRRDVEAMLRSGCDFILHGHMHQVDVLQTLAPASSVVTIAAGACYETRDYPNTYNFVRFDPTTHSGRVYLRVYSDRQGGFWTRDTINYRDIPDGVYSFWLGHSRR